MVANITKNLSPDSNFSQGFKEESLKFHNGAITAQLLIQG